VLPESPPTLTQVFALAAALCARLDEPFPETRADASELIQRLRVATTPKRSEAWQERERADGLEELERPLLQTNA
jgi:hypothetical protein